MSLIGNTSKLKSDLYHIFSVNIPAYNSSEHTEEDKINLAEARAEADNMAEKFKIAIQDYVKSALQNVIVSVEIPTGVVTQGTGTASAPSAAPIPLTGNLK